MSIRWGDKSTKPVAPAPLDDISTSDPVFKEDLLPPAAATPLMTDSKLQTAIPSTISQSSTFAGTISGKADLIIFGECTGEIILPANSLTGGPTARIKANVVADKVQIEGEMTGDICAREVKILKTGTVTSNITSPRVSIEEGAKIKGSVDMDESKVQEKFSNFNNKSNAVPSKLMPFKDSPHSDKAQ